MYQFRCGDHVFLLTAHQHWQHQSSLDIFVCVLYVYETAFSTEAICILIWCPLACSESPAVFSYRVFRTFSGGFIRRLEHVCSHIQPVWRMSRGYLEFSACLKGAIKVTVNIILACVLGIACLLLPTILCCFPAVIRELREEVRVLQGYLDAANDQIQVFF